MKSLRRIFLLFTSFLAAWLCSWAQDQITIENVEITPDVSSNSIGVKISLCNNADKALRARIALSLGSSNLRVYNCDLIPGEQEVEYTYKMPSSTKLWSEFTPECYSLNVVVSAQGMPKQLRTASVAMRDFHRVSNRFMLNGKPVFLRSTMISCHFPPNDIPPATEAAWAKIFHTAKSWGLNSLCFHGWSPSEIALKVANRMGILLLSDADSLFQIVGRMVYPDLDSLPEQSRMWMLSSGATAVEQYKRQIERAVIVDSINGFELVGLQDWPEENHEYVGVLDDQWDSKGIVPPAKWRQWCSPVTVLADYDKDVYNNGENFYAAIKVANYGPDTIHSKQVKWEIVNALNGSLLASGQMRQRDLPCGEVTPVGEVNTQLLSIVQPVEAEMRAWIDNTEIRNSWHLWVFPYLTQERLDQEAEGIMLTRSLDQAIASLIEGKKVLFSPYADELGTAAVAPSSTLGLICNVDHPALEAFPTRFFGDWQWQPLFEQGAALDVTGYEAIHPIVWLIDDYHKNRRISPLWEVKCGNGSLIVSTIPLWEDTLYDPSQPARAQLLLSLLRYMQSPTFNPTDSIYPDQLTTLITHLDAEHHSRGDLPIANIIQKYCAYLLWR